MAEETWEFVEIAEVTENTAAGDEDESINITSLPPDVS